MEFAAQRGIRETGVWIGFETQDRPLVHQRLVLPSEEDLTDPGFKSTRGGSYGNSASRARSADRDWWFPERAYVGRGFRMCWGLNDVDLSTLPLKKNEHATALHEPGPSIRREFQGAVGVFDHRYTRI